MASERTLRLLHWILPFAALPLFALPVQAQWFDLPTRNAPRTADGKPNFNAPAPRTTELSEAVCAENEKDVQHFKAIPQQLH
jgi:hypothetical protein